MIKQMDGMVLSKINHPLEKKTLPLRALEKGEILLQNLFCAVCRTDLEIFEGKVSSSLPRILGHQIIGRVLKSSGSLYQEGDLVGGYWLGSSCQTCLYCKRGEENLCKKALFRGKDLDGGFASHSICREEYVIALHEEECKAETAPLLCGGLIGFRAYKKLRNAQSIGLYGFGSAAHILLQIAVAEGKTVYVFTKEGDLEGELLAKKLGAHFVGSSQKPSPIPLEGSIIFASDGSLVPKALSDLDRGGGCVCAGIHMSDIPSFSYENLFYEKMLTCVSHLTRSDGKDFFACLKELKVRPQITLYSLEEANKALQALQKGSVKGSIVLKIDESIP